MQEEQKERVEIVQEEQEQEREKLEPIAIYQNNIYALVDDVKELKQFQGLTDEELKNNKSFFPVLVNYIYNNYIGELLGNKHGKQIVYKDIEQLDNLFSIYIDLVSRYKWNDKPFIIEFSNFIGITRDTIYQWLNGLENNNHGVKDSEILTPERSYIVRKWVDICEQALLNGSDASTVRDIFILKAKHGYRDNNNTVEVNINHKAVISADELPQLIGLKT